jgi:hypothetical protein
MRYLLQRPLTNEWLTRDFELSEGQRTRALSGPGGITGTIDPQMQHVLAADGKPLLWEWGTIIYAEIDGRIRNAGIVTKIDKEGSKLTLEAPGFMTYPHGIPYSDATNFLRVDPMVVVRHLWFHVQNTPNSNIGMTVDTITLPETAWIGDNANPKVLQWWENVDCGGEIDNLAKQAGFDYAEVHTYTNEARTSVSHRMQIGYPRLGRKRSDLRFAEGENIIGPPIAVGIDGDAFANEVIGIGRGEGAAMVHNNFALVDGRLRRPKIVTDKTADQARLDSISLAELNKRLDVVDVTQVTIRDHPNARLSAIDPGDDVLVQASLPWIGKFRLWVRVLAITEADADETVAVLSTQRSDAFIYSVTTEVA